MIEIQFGERQDNMRHGLRQFYDKKSKEELVEACIELYISRNNIMNEYNAFLDWKENFVDKYNSLVDENRSLSDDYYDLMAELGGITDKLELIKTIIEEVNGNE